MPHDAQMVLLRCELVSYEHSKVKVDVNRLLNPAKEIEIEIDLER